MLTLKALLYEYYLGPVITNNSHPSAPIYLMKTIAYYHSWIEAQEDSSWLTKYAPRFTKQRLAALVLLCWYAGAMPPKMPPALQSEKTDEEKWYQSNACVHDTWRANALAQHIYDIHDVAFKMELRLMEHEFRKRAGKHRTELGKRLRLPDLEKKVQILSAPIIGPVESDSDLDDDSMDLDASSEKGNGDDGDQSGEGDDDGEEDGDGSDDDDSDEDELGEDDSDETTMEPSVPKGGHLLSCSHFFSFSLTHFTAAQAPAVPPGSPLSSAAPVQAEDGPGDGATSPNEANGECDRSASM